MKDGNYIKIYRSMLDWEWYQDINTCRLFLHMLLKANWKDGKFQGTTVPRGSFISSLPKLSEETKLTVDEIRTALKHLEKTGEVTRQTTNRSSLFTVVNYQLYQGTSQTNPNPIPYSSQSIPSPFPAIEEEKEREEGKEIKKERKNITVSNETVCQTDVRLILDAWNELDAFGIKPVSRLSPSSKRYQSLIARIREYNTADILLAIDKIKNSSFLQGKNKQGWTITFDWFVLPNNFPKVLEGNYDNKSSTEENASSQWIEKWRNA